MSGPSRCLALLLLAALAGCSSASGLSTGTLVGRGQQRAQVLVDDRTRSALAGVVTAYGESRRVRVLVRSGTPAAIAQAVKDGMTVDAVVVTGGPSLNRIRDELTAPAFAVGLRGARYWVAPVTDVGERFVLFLGSAAGVAALRSRGFTAKPLHAAARGYRRPARAGHRA